MKRALYIQIALLLTWFSLIEADSFQPSLLPYPASVSNIPKTKQDEANPVSIENKNSAFTSAYSNQDLSEDLTSLLTGIAEQVKNFGKNPFHPDSNVLPTRSRRSSNSDADLREIGQDRDEEKEPEEGFIKEPDSEHHGDDEDTEESDPSLTSSKRDYCERYEQHYSYFCVGETTSDDPSVTRFCPSYQGNCPDMARKSPLTPWPSDPFSAPVRPISRPVSVETTDSESAEVDERDVYFSELRRRFPCKPDCDQRLFPHCTSECKCDFIYPIVQKFCNPPPMPIFLNTCRLWYNGCPKYDPYHYASQFVYNKANKGKVSSGPSLSDVSPYGIPQARSAKPFSRPHRTSSHLMPIMHAAKTLRLKRSTQEDEMVIPPALPYGAPRASGLRSTSVSSPSVSSFEHVSKTHEDISETPWPDTHSSSRTHTSHKTSHHKISHSSHSRSHKHRYSTKRSSNPSSSSFSSAFDPEPSKTTQSPQLSRRELYNKLKVLNDLTSQPVGITKKLEDPGTLNQILGATTATEDGRPRAAAVATADEEADPFKNVDRWSGLTDSRGIYHRPRSSSPFTKPGLWEPNPDDPHSRDPTNKYWYHPESLGVDWLNGQMTWGGHWAVPAAGVGGTDGFSSLHFPSIGTFLNIPDDYD